MTYTLIYHRKTIKDKSNLQAIKLLDKAIKICNDLTVNPTPLHSKQLDHDLKGQRSIRINLQHRLVYEVLEDQKIVKILSMWEHYE